MVNSFNNDLYQPNGWYAVINNNIMLSKEWRRTIEIPVDFLFGGLDAAVKFNSKMESRLKKSGKNVRIKLIAMLITGYLTHEEVLLKALRIFSICPIIYIMLRYV